MFKAVRKFVLVLFAVGLVLLVGTAIINSAVPDGSPSGISQTVDDNITEDGESVTPPAPLAATQSQQNALESAENYLEFMHFSKAGLTKQLSSSAGDGYSKADAKWAVAQLDVNWKEQAYKSAQNYQEIMPMSKAGLLKQLTSTSEGYTQAQAEYAVNKVGL